MKFVTFNIRCDYGQDGNNNFEFRKPLILKKINAEQPDVLCFQEVLPHVAAWLKENLTDYCFVGCGRGPALDDEQAAIAFRRDRFELMQMNTFWLSETPLVPGSRYAEQSTCPRTCTEALLHDLRTGRVLRVLNTHLDHQGVGARILGLRQILNYIDQAVLFPDAPVLLAGDFNAEPSGEEMKILADFPGYVNLTDGIGVTFHGFGLHPTECIDYILLRGNLSCTSVQKWVDCENGVWLSDHYPICAKLSLDPVAAALM